MKSFAWPAMHIEDSGDGYLESHAAFLVDGAHSVQQSRVGQSKSLLAKDSKGLLSKDR